MVTGFYWLQKVTGSPSALQSYPSVASKNPFTILVMLNTIKWHLCIVIQGDSEISLEKNVEYPRHKIILRK
jgi:hypothetical protein